MGWFATACCGEGMCAALDSATRPRGLSLVGLPRWSKARRPLPSKGTGLLEFGAHCCTDIFRHLPFLVTTEGAERIGYLVANLRREEYKDVVTRLQAESKEAADQWVPC